MSRFHRQIDLQGNETQLAYTQEEEDAADANDLQAPARAMSAIRAKRDTALASTDWAALPDSPAMSDGMTAYRTALRDYPATYASDNSAAFPELGE
tara:strand:+ start:262 stop:549 length:288 start_codon:yes stop_codon:yes gene_type:complete